MNTLKQTETPRALLKPTKTLIIVASLLFGFIITLETLEVLGFNLPNVLFQVWLFTLLVFIFLCLLDELVLKKQNPPELERILPSHLSLGKWGEVSLIFKNVTNNTLTLQVYDHPPYQMEFKGLPQNFKLPATTQHAIKYSILPLERGHFNWLCCEVTLLSQWKFWQMRHYVPLPSETRIYPDFTRLYGAHLTTIEKWIYYLGVRPQQRRGLGQDFHQLREYREGDTLRQIDWKATARHNFPITKEYQDERDQQIIFLLDCGQRMRIQEDELAHFDHALNACLLLSYVALRQGDAVGLATFAAEKDLFLKPSKGTHQLNTLLNTVYNLQCTQKPADFSQAVQKLLSQVKRRSLIIVITNLRYNESEETISALRYLNRHHRVLIASLREEIMDKLRTEPIHNLDSALIYCGDIHHILARNKLHEKLIINKLPVLDALPKQFAPHLVNHYLSLKRAGVW